MLRVALGCGQRGRDYRHPERLLLGHRPIAVLQELVAASCAFRSSALLYRSPGPASGLLSGSQILPQDEAGAAVHAKDVAVCPPWPGMAAACCTGVRGGGRGAVLQGGPLPAAGSRGAPRQSQLQPRYSLLGQSPILTPPAPGSPAAAHCCSLCATWGGGEAGPEPRELRHHPPPGQGLLCPGPGPQPQQVPVYADHADHVDHCASLCASSPLGPHPSSSLRLMLFQHVLRCLKILFQFRISRDQASLGHHNARLQDLAQSGPWLPWPPTRTEHAPCLCTQSDRGPCLGARGVSLGRPWTCRSHGPASQNTEETPVAGACGEVEPWILP
ncbi:uncharacterized protein LOC125753492 isoform X2 [Canis lupus dingo]|uniref:uncharacterized protein LOC125753492 isoform X2 n=1 Tax=Canis lupus dingo TaxID=286419 RepID=UPI0020C57290|nr:uncharacterized protein LOC125753492 isoform X2 [Canis lupus dingo]